MRYGTVSMAKTMRHAGLSLFADNPPVKRTFCSPKECYVAKLNADGRYGRPLPPLGELIEQGKVCAIDFPVSLNSGLARAIGCMMKLDFQRAVLNRIPKIKKDPDRYWRQVFFICDEYHEFATAGQNNPNGDEKFLALSREPRCIPIVATQSISSLHDALPGETWRTVLQAFRTKIFLTQTDGFSAKTASELCGKEDQYLRQPARRRRSLGPFRDTHVAAGRCSGLQTLKSSQAEHDERSSCTIGSAGERAQEDFWNTEAQLTTFGTVLEHFMTLGRL
jgi:hypothetical protein